MATGRQKSKSASPSHRIEVCRARMTKGCSRELSARFWSWAPRARPLHPKLALPDSSLVSAPWLGKLRDGLWLYDLSESWRPQRLKARQGRKERKERKETKISLP